jgi:hypothetical protein
MKARKREQRRRNMVKDDDKIEVVPSCLSKLFFILLLYI